MAEINMIRFLKHASAIHGKFSMPKYFFIFSGRTRSRVMKNTAKIVQSWKDKKEIG